PTKYTALCASRSAAGEMDSQRGADNPSSGSGLKCQNLAMKLNLTTETRGISMWPYRENQLTTIIIGAVVFAFFLALTVYSYRQGNRERGYFAGLVLILVASFNSLVRGVFFPNSSPAPTQIGGVFRLVNGLF